MTGHRFFACGLLLTGLVFGPGTRACGQDVASPVSSPVSSPGSAGHRQQGTETPLVIAHRGASGYVPEHTQEAAVLAHGMDVDFIEQDVVLSSDGEAVVLHDITLDEVTNVRDVFPDRVAADGHFYAADLTLDELRQLNVTERRGSKRRDPTSRFPAGQGRFRIATLREHLTLIRGLNQSRDRQIGVYVELKKPGWHHERGLDVSEVVLSLLKEFGYEDSEDRAFVQCFEFAELERIRTKRDCRLPLVMLVSELPDSSRLDRFSAIVDGLGVSISCVVTGLDKQGRPITTDLVQQCHQRSLVVHAWTVRTDDLPDWCDSVDQLLGVLVADCGVDGVFCDQPEAALRWRRQLVEAGPDVGPFRLLNERPRASAPQR